jgi:hypothetical protein
MKKGRAIANPTACWASVVVTPLYLHTLLKFILPSSNEIACSYIIKR